MNDEPLNPRVAERLARAARAAQALSEALWEGLHEELNDPRSRRVTELSERLADVSLAVASLARVPDGADGAFAAGEPPVPAAEPSAPAQPRVVPPEPPVARVIHEESRDEEWRGTPVRESVPPAEEPPSVAVLIDELAPEATQEIEIRDERGEREPTAWIASIGRRLERYERDGAQFAVLLVELADVERLRHAELPGEMARLTGLVETALSSELRPADSLTRESPGRYWLLAPETGPSNAQALAERLAEAVRRAASHRGSPLEVSIGIAVCPADGDQAAALAAHADVALYAARAAGRPVA